MNWARLLLATVAISSTLITIPVYAAVLQPGDSNVVPDVFDVSGVPNPPLLGHLSGKFSLAGGTITGAWDQFVLVDPLGITCPGCLVFAWDVSVDPASGGNVFSLNMGRYFGFMTDVGYTNEGGYAPTTVSRGAAGNRVGFDLINPARDGALSPGQTTATLVIATDATTFNLRGDMALAGFVFADRTNDRTDITGLFAPASVPEPSTTALLGLGLATFAAFRRRTASRVVRS